MAQKVKLDREAFICSICLDLLKDPVTIPCGHNYCLGCIKTHWDGEDGRRDHSCPQCRRSFTQRPLLEKNTLIAGLVEELKKTGLPAAPADHCYAGPEDVACVVCTGRKLKASKSCLTCLVSYCDEHLQPHHDSLAFRRHVLVEPCKDLQESTCSQRDEERKMPTQSECTSDDDSGVTEMFFEVETTRQNIQQRIQVREEDMKLLQQEVEAINRSADKTVEDSEEMFTELIRLLEKRSSELKQQVRSQQETEVSRVREEEEKLQQEIRELKRRDAELEELLHDKIFLQYNYYTLTHMYECFSKSSSVNIRPLRHFEDVTAAVKAAKNKLQEVLKKKWTNISQTVREVDVLLPQPELGASARRARRPPPRQ